MAEESCLTWPEERPEIAFQVQLNDKNLVKEFSGSGFVSGTVKPGQPNRGKAEMETHTCRSFNHMAVDTNFKNGIRDASSTADYCPSSSIVI